MSTYKELKGLRVKYVPTDTTSPSTAAAGDVWYNTAEGKLKAGKHFEKLYEKVWEKQEKGEHYATSTNGSTKKNYKNNYKKKLIYV